MPSSITQLALADWLLTSGLRAVFLLVAIIGGIIAVRIIAKGSVRRMIARLGGDPEHADVKRAKTLIRVITRTSTIAIIVIGLAMALSEFGLNIAPILAGAGVVGFAIGFGAQQLVRDTIAGLFILIENQYRVGDCVALDGLQGIVTDITLRRTVIRDDAGALTTVPNGDIKRSANFSKEHARIQIDLPLAYASDADRVIAIINRVGASLAQSPDEKKRIKKPIAFDRIVSFGETSMTVRASGETVPSARESVAGEYRLRLLEALKQEGIAIR